MGRFWRVYRATLVTSIIRDLEFRANFAAKVLQAFGWVAFYVIVIEVIYHNVPEVAGWNRAMGLVLGGTVLLNAGVCGVLFPSLLDVPDQVRKGTLDFVLTRPIDTQFSVSLRKLEISRIGNFLAGAVMLGFGLLHLSRSPLPVDWAAYLVCLIGGILFYYSVSFFLATLAIYFVRTDNIWVISEIMIESARYPADVFPRIFRFIAIYVVPIAVISTVPARMLVFGFDPVLTLVAALWGVGSLLLTRMFWNRSMDRYSSASS